LDPELKKLLDDLGQLATTLKEKDEERRLQIESQGTVSEELKTAIEGLTGQIEEVKNSIIELQRPDQERRDAERQSAAPVEDPEDKGGFENFGDFLHAVRFDRRDARTVALEARALSMGVGASGGVLVPPQFRSMLTRIQPQDAIVRPRATVIPAGTPPDAPVTMPLLNQAGAAGVFAGVAVTWIGEGDTKPETEPTFLEITLTPHEVAARTIMTDKLLRNAPAASGIVQTLLRGAIMAAEDTAFISGNGVARPLGFVGHASSINVARAGAGAIAYADVVNMYARILQVGSSGLVWTGNPSIIPQLCTMVDAGNHLVWQASAREGEPPTLMGIPFMKNQRQAVLGAQGDLMLLSLGGYIIKDGSPLSISASEHVYFETNRTVIKAYWNVDGQPWLTTPLTLEDGATTVSPFVVLQ
jgi:HK97 family phage major capsid protein